MAAADIPQADAPDNLNPAQLARRAVESASGRRWVLANLRCIARHYRESGSLIERTGAHICALAGPRELRRIAESAESSEQDRIGQAICLLLLSGYWRT
jgi:hypothetical protein